MRRREDPAFLYLMKKDMKTENTSGDRIYGKHGILLPRFHMNHQTNCELLSNRVVAKLKNQPKASFFCIDCFRFMKILEFDF